MEGGFCDLGRCARFAATALMLSAGAPGEAAAWSKSYEAAFTPFELKSLTNDPQTNPALATFAEKLGDPAAEALKVIRLARLLSGVCVGATENAAVVKAYEAARLSRLSSEKRKDAEFKVQHLFDYFDYLNEAQLCAGLDHLFGAKGALLPGAVSPGTGEMNLLPWAPK